MLNLDRYTNGSATIIIGLAVMLFSGFFMTRITKRLKLPNVTGYILSGIVIGPYVFHIIPETMISHMDFVIDIALAFIAFDVGKYFRFSQLRLSGRKILTLTAFEALTAAAAISICMIFIFKLPVSFSLLLGAIGSATAPASTIMTIRQYHAKGEFVNTVLQVVALDDAISLIAFSICAAIAQKLESGYGKLDWSVFALPFALNIVAILLGMVCGFVLKWIISDNRSREHSLILVNAVILTLTGFCTTLNISPLLACMVMGTVYVNIIDSKKLFKQVNHFTPPVLLLFFVLSGMKLNLPMLATSGIIGVSYFIIRIIGKYLGSYIGASICHTSPEIKNYIGLALIPQAGVSIGLAALGQRILPNELGMLLSTIILSSGVLYEMVGPACAKASLFLSHTVESKPRPPV